MGFFSKKKKVQSSEEGWGNSAWDEQGGVAPAPQSVAPAMMAPQSFTLNEPVDLTTALEPIFLFICEQHRVVREGNEISYQRVRAGMEQLLRQLDDRANQNPYLRQHLDHLYAPLVYVIDYTFAAPENGFPFCDDWHDNRIGFSRGVYEGGLAGDEAFFDYLDRALATDPHDASANERLAFYYLALGLGFTGVYFHKDAEDQTILHDYMQKIYPRISHLVELNMEERLTPDAYEHLNRKDFVVRARERPLLMVAAILMLCATLLVGYALLYQMKIEDLKSALEVVAGAAASKP